MIVTSHTMTVVCPGRVWRRSFSKQKVACTNSTLAKCSSYFWFLHQKNDWNWTGVSAGTGPCSHLLNLGLLCKCEACLTAKAWLKLGHQTVQWSEEQWQIYIRITAKEKKKVLEWPGPGPDISPTLCYLVPTACKHVGLHWREENSCLLDSWTRLFFFLHEI